MPSHNANFPHSNSSNHSYNHFLYNHPSSTHTSFTTPPSSSLLSHSTITTCQGHITQAVMLKQDKYRLYYIALPGKICAILIQSSHVIELVFAPLEQNGRLYWSQHLYPFSIQLTSTHLHHKFPILMKAGVYSIFPFSWPAFLLTKDMTENHISSNMFIFLWIYVFQNYNILCFLRWIPSC